MLMRCPLLSTYMSHQENLSINAIYKLTSKIFDNTMILRKQFDYRSKKNENVR